jgi:hypothetical protein
MVKGRYQLRSCLRIEWEVKAVGEAEGVARYGFRRNAPHSPLTVSIRYVHDVKHTVNLFIRCKRGDCWEAKVGRRVWWGGGGVLVETLGLQAGRIGAARATRARAMFSGENLGRIY